MIIIQVLQFSVKGLNRFLAQRYNTRATTNTLEIKSQIPASLNFKYKHKFYNV